MRFIAKLDPMANMVVGTVGTIATSVLLKRMLPKVAVSLAAPGVAPFVASLAIAITAYEVSVKTVEFIATAKMNSQMEAMMED